MATGHPGAPESARRLTVLAWVTSSLITRTMFAAKWAWVWDFDVGGPEFNLLNASHSLLALCVHLRVLRGSQANAMGFAFSCQVPFSKWLPPCSCRFLSLARGEWSKWPITSTCLILDLGWKCTPRHLLFRQLLYISHITPNTNLSSRHLTLLPIIAYNGSKCCWMERGLALETTTQSCRDIRYPYYWHSSRRSRNKHQGWYSYTVAATEWAKKSTNFAFV